MTSTTLTTRSTPSRWGRALLTTSLVAGALAMAGCAHRPSHSQIGTGVGAVAGGVLGNAVFGTTLGTVGGAAAGALIGNEVSRDNHRGYRPRRSNR